MARGMVTTVTVTEKRTVRRQKGAGLGPGRPNGNGSHKNGGPGGGPSGGDGGERWSPERYRIGVLVGLASILMLFAALASTYVWLAASDSWRPVEIPALFWLSTLLIGGSSLTFRKANRSLRQGESRRYTRWLLASLALGLAFLGSQLLAWRELVARGVYLAGNQHSTFLYLLTGMHGLHLVGGILAMNYLLFRQWSARGDGGVDARRRTVANVVGLYWHFMGGLWVFIFLLLLLWR